jgi:hypothetical protein
VLVPEITTGDHSKGTDGRERPRLRAAQRVLSIAVAHDFSIHSARQLQVPGERLTRVEVPFRRVAIALGPARVITRVVFAAARVF